jgi:hypothetical protein
MARAYGPYEQRHSGICPGERRVVEDARVLLAAGVQQVDEVVAFDTQRLGSAVEVQPVPSLVLHFGHEDGLAPQRRRPGDPVALGLHADDLGVRVLRDLADQRAPVLIGQPVARLDALVRLDQ